jgi:nucleoside-diphosphate-sugar epimerase
VSGKNILVTGGRGYLASNLIKNISHDNNIILFEGDVRHKKKYSDIDLILHFASPSDRVDFLDVARTSSTIIEGTINILNIARANNCRFVFASTLGVCYLDTDCIYTISKLAMEKYITSMYNNYVILRIPRVYSKCRRKGLIKQLRDGTVPHTDYDKHIEYITVDDFVNQTKPILFTHGNKIHNYTITHKQTIGKINQWIKT